MNEAGWKFTILLGGREQKNLQARRTPTALDLHVEGRHLICKSRISITLTNEELRRVCHERADPTLDAIFICKATLITAHEPCPFLRDKVMLFHREGAIWGPMFASRS